MSIYRKKDNFNYWPSISDMFLVFFLITLILLVDRTLIQQKGDSRVIIDVAHESNILFSWVRENDAQSRYKTPRYTLEKGTNTYPRLAAGLYQIYEFIVAHQKDRPSSMKKSEMYQEALDYYEQCKMDSSQEMNFAKSIQLLYFYLFPDGKSREGTNAWGHTIYDHYLSDIRHRLTQLSGLQSMESLLNDDQKNKLLEEENKKLAAKYKQLQKNLLEVASLFNISEKEIGDGKDLKEKIQKEMRLVLRVLDDKDISFAQGQKYPNIINKAKWDEFLSAITERLKSQSNLEYIIEIVGHTCTNPFTSFPEWSYERNTALGLERAKAVGKKLEEALGSELARKVQFKYASSGWTHPLETVAGEGTEDYKTRLRRVEVLVRPKQEGEQTILFNNQVQ